MQARAEGSTVVHLNVSDVRQIPVTDLPSVSEQRRIAGVLGSLDDLIDTNRTQIELVRALSQSAFEQIARRSSSVALGAVAVINPARTGGLDSGTLTYIDIASVGDGHLTYPRRIGWPDAPGRARNLAEAGDTLWSMVRPNRRAHALVLRPPFDLVVSTGLAVLRGVEIGPATLFAATDRPAFVDHLVSHSEGSAYPAVRPETFASAPIPLPNPADGREFEALLWPLWQWVGELEDEIAQLMRTRDELLPLLMSGRVRLGEVAP
jgi:type I restriction enzyme S subunit